MSKPSIDGDIIIKVPDGAYVLLAPDYYSNEYVKATYSNREGYLYSVTLTQTSEIKNLTEKSSGSTTQSLYNSNKSTNSNKSFSGASPATRTYYRGPRGGCYYISSGGSKVYVDRSLCH
jgi:hypothetical protein